VLTESLKGGLLCCLLLNGTANMRAAVGASVVAWALFYCSPASHSWLKYRREMCDLHLHALRTSISAWLQSHTHTLALIACFVE
jgi:hypothetical protein